MARRIRFLTTLSAIALSGALAASCSGEQGEGEGEGARAASRDDGGSGESEGEGGGASGEGEGAHLADNGSHSEGESDGEGESEGEGKRAVTGKPAYLSGLLIMEGHLRAGAALYIAGDVAMAATHMKHPEDEIYTTLKPAFAAYDDPGLANEIAALSSAAADGASEAAIADALSAVVDGVSRAMAASEPTTKDLLLAVTQTLNTAGDEFALGVDSGSVTNPHEYQDAFGFMAALSARLSTMVGDTAAERQALDVAREQVGIALAVAPGVDIPDEVDGEAQTIYGAAARVEIAALGL